MNPHIDAKLTAFRDITEDCRKDNAELKLPVEFARRNLIIWERDICEYAGIPVPDFRIFNGGDRHKKNKEE